MKAHATQGSQSNIFVTGDGTEIVKVISAIQGTVEYKKALQEIYILKKLQGEHKFLISVTNIKKTTQKVIENFSDYKSYRPIKEETTRINYEVTMPRYKTRLADHLNQPLPKMIFYFRQILMGLNHLHNMGFVHGSLSPENVLLDENDNICLIDFGDAEPIGCHDNIVDIQLIDDLSFRRRPLHKGVVTIYNYLSSNDAREVVENVGLLPLTKILFNTSKEGKAFYHFLVGLWKTGNNNYIQLALQHPFLQISIQDQLTRIYNKSGLMIFQKKAALLDQLVDLTPSKKLSELTTHLLVKRPPIGFQSLQIEFPLRQTCLHEMKEQKAKLSAFQEHLKKYPRYISLKEAAKLARESYQLAKENSDPDKKEVTAISPGCELFDKKFSPTNFIRLKIYGDEKSSDLDIQHMPRVYIAIEKANKKNKQIVLVFMGAEVMPKPHESWWTNQRKGQTEIWRNVNFFRDAKQHTGIQNYTQKIVKRIEAALLSILSKDDLSHAKIELMGHSTGGVIAVETAKCLGKSNPQASIHVIGFATPNFMNATECANLKAEFKNDGHRSYFNLIAEDDPACAIYGENLFQPAHTILVPSTQLPGKSFRDVYAASEGTTRKVINNHLMRNYLRMVESPEVSGNIKAKL